MSLLDWMAGSSVSAVGAGRRPAEMNESLLVKYVFVVTLTGLTEKGMKWSAQP